MTDNYHFSTRMEVRDYECDIEGIVNNANYLHYMEHTRHLFLKACGISFAQMHNKGIDAVVARYTVQYKIPLRCDDVFDSKIRYEKKGIKHIFHHHLFRCSDNSLVCRATADLVCLVNGVLGDAPEYNQAFENFVNQQQTARNR